MEKGYTSFTLSRKKITFSFPDNDEIRFSHQLLNHARQSEINLLTFEQRLASLREHANEN